MTVAPLEGMLKIANLLLSVIAGILALTLLKSSKKRDLKPWLFLIIALAFFALQEVLGMLRAFGVYESIFLTHLVPMIILVFVLAAVITHLKIIGED